MNAWAQRVNLRLSSALVGFDRATTPEGAEEFYLIVQRLLRGGLRGVFERKVNGFDPEAPLGRDALLAYDELDELFFRPALERREEIVARIVEGRAERSELPQDLLSLIALRLDPAWDDRALALREAAKLATVGPDSITAALIHALSEAFAWFEEHPDDRERRTDEDFLVRIAGESLRLHPLPAGFARRALEDVQLCKGTPVAAGQLIAMRSGPANADPNVWGNDALEFDPNRTCPEGALPYGLAFGAGPHMCIGLPIVMGSTGADGNLVYLLKILFAANVRPDPDRPAPALYRIRGQYQNVKGVEFPVLLDA